jgi:hypothetical protein
MSFSVPCLLLSFVLFFCGVGGHSVQGAMLVYPRSGCGNITFRLFAHLLVWVSQAGLELASGSMGALLVSQCNMVWRSFVWAGGSGCQTFAYSWWFFSAKCGSSISARFLIFMAHTVCFLTLVAILDPLSSVLLLVFLCLGQPGHLPSSWIGRHMPSRPAFIDFINFFVGVGLQ